MNKKWWILIGSALVVALLFYVRPSRSGADAVSVQRTEPRQISFAEAVQAQPGIAEDSGPDGSMEAAPASPVLAEDDVWLQIELSLLSAGSSAERLRTLQALYDWLLALDPADAAALVQRYLATGRDVTTGLPFDVGPSGVLRTAPALRVALLHILAFIDPQLSLQLARNELGQTAVADEHAVHLRNFGWFGLQSQEDVNFLRTMAVFHISQDQWRSEPTDGFAEGFDAIVFAGATEAVPALGRGLRADAPGNLRNPSFLALDRLAMDHGAEVLPQLLEDLVLLEDFPMARAGIFARADVGDPSQMLMVRDYLLSGVADAEEIRYFFEIFPNTNLHFSTSLLTDNPVPDSAELEFVFRLSLVQTEHWLNDPGMVRFSAQLHDARSRLLEILGFNSFPNP